MNTAIQIVCPKCNSRMTAEMRTDWVGETGLTKRVTYLCEDCGDSWSVDDDSEETNVADWSCQCGLYQRIGVEWPTAVWLGPRVVLKSGEQMTPRFCARCGDELRMTDGPFSVPTTPLRMTPYKVTTMTTAPAGTLCAECGATSTKWDGGYWQHAHLHETSNPGNSRDVHLCCRDCSDAYLDRMQVAGWEWDRMERARCAR